MRKILNPSGIARPASAYHHALLIERPARELHMSGQLGERPDGTISDDFTEQARQVWINIKAILAEGEMAIADIVKVTSYIVGRENIRPYVAVHRDEVGEHLPPWTLVLVAGLGSPSYLVEVEAIAAR
jgi:enamine deaminase RidA (YjgF/YER057c/UK114 family)